ncbi:MAG: hypothetical protein P8Y40_13665 [Desulfobacterales bacterium]
MSAQSALSKILRDGAIDIQDVEAEHSLQYRDAVRKEGIVSMLAVPKIKIGA